MPSPFPGMDPYLEHPSVFPDLHDSLMVGLKEALQPLLPERYFAQTREDVWLELAGRYVEPDVNVLRASSGADTREPSAQPSAVAVATQPKAKAVVVPAPLEERKQLSLEVYSREDPGHRLVTAIEILSMTNKTPGGTRRGEYARKQWELLNAEVHLVEIDLLRGGQHTTAVPKERALQKAGHYDYHVCVHRFDRRGEFLVYPVLLEERLPEIDVLLLPGDGSVTADLQAVLDRAYDGGPYRKRIRYGQDEVVPPLSESQAQWARRVLEARPVAGR
ncbi:MAG: DUF4058 family protein [Planctomycetes bacterium]|nr:DUF4058 family protein [Planctomycetota bacterium]